MAIAFARLEFIKRSVGKNAVAKAAYNSKTCLYFEGNCVLAPELYDFSQRDQPIYHEILLPEGVDENFRHPEILWNHAEKKEGRCNSQTAAEIVLALPDDECISHEDRIEMTKRFVHEHFVSKGVGAQVDIHLPEKQVSIGEDGKSIMTKEHNNHAHILITTRRFKENGKELGEKIRGEIFGQVSKGIVVSANSWGKIWTGFQNTFFEEKGLSLRVDEIGIVSQKHVGPKRMRNQVSIELLKANEEVKKTNEITAENSHEVLKKITETRSIFSKDDVERYIDKSVAVGNIEEFKKDFWNRENLVQLLDKKTHKPLDKFTSREVLKEEVKIFRIADRIQSKKAFFLKGDTSAFTAQLNNEQKESYDNLLAGQRLSCLQGYAGTGKSYLLKALKDIYNSKGYTVRAFGPDHSTTEVLKRKGFFQAENAHYFVFSHHYGKRQIGKKEVWFVDEAGKLSNSVLLELLKKADRYNARIILSGDHAQLPSVSRGGMFKVFCERYGSEVLQEIQRQENLLHREFVKKLATGNLGTALQEIHAQKCIRWTNTKIEALGEMVEAWAKDSERKPEKKYLLVAHSNDDVRNINHAVHRVRQSREEVQKKEFCCQTAKGEVLVSVGDLIEFRGRDLDLGVRNGLRGVLLNAEKNCFTVKIDEGRNKVRIVSFDPEKYHRFQLGYAVTCHRSQGDTVDKAYILHASYSSKESFFVNLSRHVKDVQYFVPKEVASSFSKLKQQISRSQVKENTFDYLTQEDLDQAQKNREKLQGIEKLKSSQSYKDKAFGYTAEVWGALKGKTKGVLQKYSDRRENQTFYEEGVRQATLEGREKPSVAVEEVDRKSSLKLQEVSSSIDGEKLSNSIVRNEEKIQRYQKESYEKEIDYFPEKPAKISSKPEAIRKYFSVMEEASSLGTLVRSESEEFRKEEKDCFYFKEWQESCGKRNEAAHKVKMSLTKEELKEQVGDSAQGFIFKHAERHQKQIDRQEGLKTHDLEDKLKEDVETLLFRLFPDGPTRRTRTQLSFHGKGSLAVCVQGERAGSFYDFENKEGGGLLHLIKRELQLDHREAKSWAREFLGEAREMEVPKSFIRSPGKFLEGSWKSVYPPSSAPSLEKINKYLSSSFDESARYAYKDEDGRLLGYILRLEDRQTGEKQIRPLSYGYYKEKESQTFWNIKGFETEGKRSLYNLHLLKNHLSSRVLIVEGEKAADAAASRMSSLGEDFVCLTWMGGASAVGKTDWTPLIGRDVVIWPDNDKSGVLAAEDVCSELRKVELGSLKIVDPKSLSSQLPEKWDLADPLPSSVREKDLRRLINSSSLEKIVNCKRLAWRCKSEGAKIDPENYLDRIMVNRVLFRVDERMRSDLEKEYGSSGIRREISEEVIKIICSQDSLQKNLREHYGAEGDLLKRLTTQVILHRAKTGKEPLPHQVETMKDVIRKIGNVTQIEKEMGKRKECSEVEKKVYSLAIDKGIEKACERSLGRRKSQEGIGELVKKESVKETPQLLKDVQREMVMQQNLQKQQELQRSMDRGLER